MARKHLGPERQQWKGIDANEAAFGSVNNALVAIVLDGVVGVSPEIPGEGWRMVSPEKADQYIERGRRVLADFESQEMAPGGARGRAQKWMDRHIDSLRKLVTDAEAVRAGKKPQKQTPESYAELRKSLGVGEAPRRRAAPQPTPVTPPSHDAPPRSFTSAGGRTFTLGPVDRSGPKDPRRGNIWPILYNGEDAGKLFQNDNYGPDKPWHATTRQLFWKFAGDAPTGIGFDVSAFATAQQALDAWGRSADQILDWSEGKIVPTIYGRHQRAGGGREVRERSELTGPGSDGLYHYRGASIELSGWPGRYHATIRFRSQERDVTSPTAEGVLDQAKRWIDDAPELRVHAMRRR